MVITRVGSLTSPNLLVNHTRPPFNDIRVRRAVDHFAQWPRVKNLVPHHSLYDFGRMQEVWLDR